MLDSITELFRPQLPTWACEFTPRHVIAAGVDSKRTSVNGKAAVDLRAGMLTGSPSDKNFADANTMLNAVKSALGQAGFKGSEIGVVIPDDATRITFLTAENLPAKPEERDTFIRWKLKKSTPFDVESAQIAFKVIGPQDVLVALSPRTVINEYVDLMEKADLHAGYVIPSTLAVLNLLRPSPEDTLFLKTAPGCITTAIFRGGRLQFYRRVADMPIYDAVYPTVMYYQDKLMGAGILRVVACSYDNSLALLSELREKMSMPVQQVEPKQVPDIFKPALGAVGFL